MSISKIFIPNFVRVLTNKRKYIEQNFYSVAGVMPLGWDLGVLGVNNFSVGICDGAPSTAHSCLCLILIITYMYHDTRFGHLKTIEPHGG